MKSHGVVLVAVLMFCGVLAGCGHPAVTREVVVPGERTWTDTGLTVKEGQRVSIEARGAVFANATVSGGPDGVAGHPEWARFCVLPDSPHVALIARIGTDGKPFYVGASSATTAAKDGSLFLGINDKGVTNNSGSFVAMVTVR